MNFKALLFGPFVLHSDTAFRRRELHIGPVVAKFHLIDEADSRARVQSNELDVPRYLVISGAPKPS